MAAITPIVSSQQAFFMTHQTKGYDFRLRQLKALLAWTIAHEDDILAALQEDLGKHPYEGYITEVAMVKQELTDAIKHLKRWMRPKRVPTAIGQLPGVCRIHPEPYGVALIMSPWNYPFQLTVAPLVGALAAGNCAVVKPSAYSPATSSLISRMAEELFPAEYVSVVQGGRAENTALLEKRFDYIFFTGSPEVGRKVMEKASRHLTPISLELGGKSPVIIDETANMELTAKRLAWGKFVNCGQTCVAPDYVLVHQSREQALLDALIAAVRALYTSAPLLSPEYPRIVNEKHFARLVGLLGDGSIALGGQIDAATLRIAPTLMTDVALDAPVMREEIFGPILPILTYRRLEDALRQIQSRPKPLALYLFTQSKETEARVLREVSFGGGCVNDTVMHLATPHMPFGGVGESGMGGYHGFRSFQTFSHEKSILKRGSWPDVPLRYPPYGERLKRVRKMV